MLPPRLRPWLTPPRALPLALIAVALLGIPWFALGLTADDVTMAGLHGTPDWHPLALFEFDLWMDDRPRMMRAGVLPWWTDPGFAVRFLRPIASATHALDFALWPDQPWLMHAQSLAWYAALVAIVSTLYRRWIPTPWVAGLATLMFALDETHGQSFGWISARNGVVGAVFGALALVAHDRWRRDGWRAGAALGPALLLLGLLSAEATVCFAGYLGAYALTLERGSWPTRIATVLPHAAVVIAWRVAYVQLGYGALGSGLYVDISGAPLAFLARSVQTTLLLGLSQLTLPLAEVIVVLEGGLLGLAAALGALALAGVAWATRGLLRESAAARFFGLGLLLAGMPFGATLPSDRLLLSLGIGGFGLIACGIEAIADGRLTGRGVRLLGGAALAVHLGLAAVMLPARSATMGVLDDLNRSTAHAMAVGPERHAVLLNAPLDLFILYLPFQQEREGWPLPASAALLYTGPDALTLTRVDADTLSLRAEGGWAAGSLYRFFWGKDHRMQPGDTVALDSGTVEVTEVSADGRPVAVAFHTLAPLDEAPVTWLSWQGDGPAPVALPKEGETVTLPAVSLF
ncbi:MAG: hypothetical protein H6739_30760 [Alphaproteobacteria bacterium]|nr:hypothetical protein [Alphaproteobacteria bacterium]